MRATPGLRIALEPWLARWSAPASLAPPVVVGCSGGPDSLALLALSVARGVHPIAVHVDHGLRPESAGEVEIVRAQAASLGTPFRSVRAHVTPGPGLEARARVARRDALERVRAEEGASSVLLGHTGDDQAETVLLNLLRGAATTGLSGMPRVHGSVVRPLLDLTRADTVEICARVGLAPLEDPMNADPAFRRVWLRREVIPLLESGTGRAVRPLLARQADVLRAESDYLDELAAFELAAALDETGALVGARVAALAPAIARRVVRRWLSGEGPPRPLHEVDAVVELARGVRHAVDLGDGRRVERVAGLLHAVAPRPVAEAVAVELPGSAAGLGVVLESWVERAAPVRWPDGRWCCVLDADAAGPHAVLRPPRPHERFTPLGLEGTKRVTTALAEAGIPPSSRPYHPVLAAPDGPPLWVLGYRVAAPVRVLPTTRRFLWIRAEYGGRGSGGGRFGR